MKNFLLAVFAIIFIGNECYAQTASNDLNVALILAPIKNINYNAPDSTDILIRLKNNGPNEIKPYDSLYFKYSISQVDTASVVSAFEFDTAFAAGNMIRVGGVATFLIAKNFQLDGSGRASVCVDITGTWEYPINENKLSSACSQFLVGVEKVNIKPSAIYFSSGILFVEMNDALKAQMQIFDITGKEIKRIPVAGKLKQSIPFKAQSKGFYFLKITDYKGHSYTSKFVVN